MTTAVLALLAVGLACSLPLTAILVRVGARLGALDSAGASGHVKALRPVPNIGGVAIAAALWIPLSLGLAAEWLGLAPRAASLVPQLQPLLPRLAESAPFGAAFLGGLLVLHVLGLVDDRRGLGPLPKLLVQAAVALVLAVGFDVRLLHLLDAWGPAGHAASVLLTVLWIVAVVNAMNFMDNMDGLAGGVGCIAALLLMTATILVKQWFIAGTLALLAGGLLGFLAFNAPLRRPARIFMGDGGSLVVGWVLAVMTVRTTFTAPSEDGYALGTAWYGVLMPLVILAVPLYDMVAVSAIRIRQGRSPFVGDQQHLSHRLVERGLSRRGAVMVIWALAFITGVGGVSLGTLAPWQAALVGVQTLAVLLVLGLLEGRMPR
ncbi:MAG: MraY family glycosyltransferase [Phycisphaerales bacterium]